MRIIDRLTCYRSNEIRIIEIEETIEEIKIKKRELDEEIKVSAPNLKPSGRNKRDFVKNSIEPQIFEREKTIESDNKQIDKLIAEKTKLIIFQKNTKTLVRCYFPKMEQDIIRMRYFENYRVSEIAQEKNITENAVQKILSRIKKA